MLKSILHFLIFPSFRLVAMLEQMNSVTLKDLQSELQVNGGIFELISVLGD